MHLRVGLTRSARVDAHEAVDEPPLFGERAVERLRGSVLLAALLTLLRAPRLPLLAVPQKLRHLLRLELLQ